MNYTGNDNLDVMKLALNYNKFLIKLAIDCIQNKNYKKILDFGCSDGFFIENIREYTNIDIIGVEVDNVSIEKCKNKNIKIYKNLLDIEDEIDFIYSFNVLEHIDDDESILELMNKKLSDSGYLLIYVPAMMFLYSSMDKKVGHVRRYSKNELKTKLLRLNFHIEKIEYCDSLGVVATLLYKIKDFLFNNNNGDLNKNIILFYDFLFPIIRVFDKLFFKYFLGKNILVIAKKKNPNK